MCLFVTRALNSISKKLSPVSDENTFIDEVYIEEYMLPAIKQMQRAGIVNGFENGEFRHNNSTTRAMAAAVIERVLNNVN